MLISQISCLYSSNFLFFKYLKQIVRIQSISATHQHSMFFKTKCDDVYFGQGSDCADKLT